MKKWRTKDLSQKIIARIREHLSEGVSLNIEYYSILLPYQIWHLYRDSMENRFLWLHAIIMNLLSKIEYSVPNSFQVQLDEVTEAWGIKVERVEM